MATRRRSRRKSRSRSRRRNAGSRKNTVGGPAIAVYETDLVINGKVIGKVKRIKAIAASDADKKTASFSSRGPGSRITSTKPDKWDRYLCDVYLTPAEGPEIFLNNRLLELGLARRYDDVAPAAMRALHATPRSCRASPVRPVTASSTP